jgi:ArsR family metal-binding transcriptional regulator
MPIHDYVIRMVRSECNVSSEKLNALVELADDLGDLLPYLNAVLGPGDYSHAEKILTVKHDGHLITFRPRQIAITKLDDEDEAKKVTEVLIRLANETAANRDRIAPSTTFRRAPRALDLFRLLPGKNCAECGEATCLAFAMKLAGGEAVWGGCPLLHQEQFAAKRIKLRAMLGATR